MSDLNDKYSKANFLIYVKWETPFHLTPSKICGSLLLDSALSESEAKEKVISYKYNYDNCNYIDSRIYSVIYIRNQKHWW
jgi:hypothetical protein